MREYGHEGHTRHTLIGFQTALAAEGDLHLTLRYGAAMAPSEISFQMDAKQAGRLAQGLLLAMSVGGDHVCKSRGRLK